MKSIKVTFAAVLFAAAACSAKNETDRCMKAAFEDYEVVKDRHMTDPISDRMLIKLEAQAAFGKAARECQIRHGDPADVENALKQAEAVRDDQDW